MLLEKVAKNVARREWDRAESKGIRKKQKCKSPRQLAVSQDLCQLQVSATGLEPILKKAPKQPEMKLLLKISVPTVPRIVPSWLNCRLKNAKSSMRF